MFKESSLLHAELTSRILAGAVEVHRHLGPGLLEAAYRACLVHQLSIDGMSVRQEIAIPMTYKDLQLPMSYRADLIVEDTVLLEPKSVERFLPIHEAQILTYLRLCKLQVGLLINFNATSLKHSVRRFLRPA